MNLLIIAYLFYFYNLIILLNAENDTGKTSVHDNAANVDDVPRVKIKVFRGPSKEEDGEQYATWGFWIKQPAAMKLAR